ncbi:MAG: efflux RND transporter periplasmic adaptor subunit [Acidobacteriota bacterium]|nr:efflux RND transporter periplasmic adaptor subunit [Acidobacteriota bacterium]
MDVESRDEQDRRRRRRVRWVSIIGVLAVLVGASLVLINMSASKANGADQEGAAEAAGDTDQQGEAESENGKKNRKKNGKKGEQDKEEKAPVPVEVAEVTSGTVSSYITSTANLVAEFQVRILSEVDGRVARLFVAEGDFVHQGKILASLVRDDAQIAFETSKLKTTNARLAYERAKDLSEKELVSREDFDKFTMEYEIARQEQAEAEWQLEKTTIRAPFSGKISERMLQVGQNIRPGDELFELTDLDPLIARIFLPERDVLGLEEGRDVKIALNAAEGTRFAGRIRQISPVVDTATGTVKVTVEAIDPPAMVRPGSFVSIHIVRETHPEAVVVPREAVLRELQSAHVFIIDGEVAKRRDVTLGLEEGVVVEALSGLALGDQVIIAGQGGLKDGAKVKVLGEELTVETDPNSDDGADSETAEQVAE